MPDKPKVAVVYHYFEVDETYKDNLVFFLSVAYREDIDFFVVIAEGCSADLPEKKNITYLHGRDWNWDFGGYIDALNALGERIDAYGCIIFINTSVRGPFLPPTVRAGWHELFTSLLQGDVHLVGSSINILAASSPLADRFRSLFAYAEPFSHVQTTAYALTGTALAHLRRIGFYDVSEMLDKDSVIARYEIRFSQEIKRQGWNMRCLLGGEYNRIDYRRPHSDVNITSKEGDPLFANAYFGRTPHATELVFMKTNRDLMSDAELYSLTYCALAESDAGPLGDWSERRALKDKAFRRIAPPSSERPLARRGLRRRLKGLFLSPRS